MTTNDNNERVKQTASGFAVAHTDAKKTTALPPEAIDEKTVATDGVSPTTKLNGPVDRTDLNTEVTLALSYIGWVSKTDEDEDWLNEITHQIANAIDPE